jgi:hypothetical protein
MALTPEQRLLVAILNVLRRIRQRLALITGGQAS